MKKVIISLGLMLSFQLVIAQDNNKQTNTGDSSKVKSKTIYTLDKKVNVQTEQQQNTTVNRKQETTINTQNQVKYSNLKTVPKSTETGKVDNTSTRVVSNSQVKQKTVVSGNRNTSPGK